MATEPANTPEVHAEDTPKIHIRFFGSIRVSANMISDDIVFIPDTTVYGLMLLLSDIYGKALHDELLDEKGSGGLRDDLMVTLNEAIINHEKAAEVVISPGDIVALYPTFLGGG
jgi:molybdopterin converting factor small subunit